MRRAILASLVIPFLSIAAAAQSTVHFTIDAAQDVHPISRFIYGINQKIPDGSNLPFERLGGNRLTAYNWITNASNAGSDYHYVNDGYLGGGDAPGGAIAAVLQNAYDHNAGALITVPINGLVSADQTGPVDIHDPARFTKRFKPEAPAKNSPFTLTPDPNAPVVYQDEFINWVKSKYPYGQSDADRPICFAMDNEPETWPVTHPEIHPQKLTYAELLAKTIAYSTAIKNVEPSALIYGPVNYGWDGMISLQKAQDANGRDFLTWYLRQLAQASIAAHKRLLDVLDFHWYPEATGGGVRVVGRNTNPQVVAARLQAPRSLWDPDYLESSWITHDSLHASIDLIPRIQKKIADNFPGTKLSVSEYNYGAGADISGGLAEADVLGVFGKMGVFSANEWPLSPTEPFIDAAFAMFRNFDGLDTSFGDTSISAATDDIANTSIYASVDSDNPNRLIVIAINKSAQPITANLQLKNAGPFARADIFQLTPARSKAVPAGILRLSNPRHLSCNLPPFSVSTLRFVAIPR